MMNTVSMPVPLYAAKEDTLRLVSAAADIFERHAQLQNAQQVLDLHSYRASLECALQSFQKQIEEVEPMMFRLSSYLLCSFLDEAVMAFPGVASDTWPSLLQQYFKETWGGETVFKIHQHAMQSEAKAPLLALVYVCLCLGFKGQYALDEQGEHKLEQLKLLSYQRLCLLNPKPEEQPELEVSPVGLSTEGDRAWFKAMTWLGLGMAGLGSLVFFLNFFLDQAASPILSTMRMWSGMY